MGSDVPNEHLLHVLPVQGDHSPFAAGKRHHQHSVDQFEEPIPNLLAYATTKGAIANFTAGLAQMVAKQGIRVNCVAPGPIWTPLIPSTMPDEAVKTFGENTPLGRAGQPAELAPAYVLLASAEASYMTGALIPVTGGRPML